MILDTVRRGHAMIENSDRRGGGMNEVGSQFTYRHSSRRERN
jgi:hypothetical protein